MSNSLLYHQSTYYSYHKLNINLPSVLVTVRDPDNLKIITRYLSYSNLRKKILPKRTLFPKIGKVVISRTIENNIISLIYNVLMGRQQDSYLNLKLALKDINSFTFGLNLEWEGIFYQSLFISDGIIYDIITRSKDRTRIICNLLGAFVMLKYNGYIIKGIGLIILSSETRIIIEDLSDWNYKLYWEKIIEANKEKSKRENLYKASDFKQCEFANILGIFGSHVRKENLITHLQIDSKRGYQFFMTARGYQVKYTKEQIEIMKTAITLTKGIVFIHSPYVCVLSKPWGKSTAMNNLEESLVVKCLVDLLNFSYKTGIIGVVVHVGKKTGFTEKEAIDRMRETFIMAVRESNGSNHSDLILETPAGQNGELLTTPETFSQFWLDLPEDVRLRSSVCVDSCHVFASGYRIMEYIAILEEKSIPIKLIHYNDSQFDIGCCKDRHIAIGKGYVGFEDLYNLATWAIKNNIPCVYE